MKYEIYELMNNIHAELIDASTMFRLKNSDESVEVWKPDEYRRAERMFENAIRMIKDLETFFCEGDEILPEAERERLEREFLEDLVADEMLEG
jgi:hypothetical protein